MPITNACRANMLAAAGITHASLHSGFPGASGVNEIAGGAPAYARKAVAFNAPVAGFRTQSGNALFDVPAGATARYIGYWDAASGGNFLGYHPLGNSPAREFVTDLAADVIRSPAHGLVNGDTVVFVGDTPPSGLVEGTVYFVVSATTDTVQVSATAGGAAIDLTSQAGTACQMIKMVAEAFGSQGTVTLSGAVIGLNF